MIPRVRRRARCAAAASLAALALGCPRRAAPPSELAESPRPAVAAPDAAPALDDAWLTITFGPTPDCAGGRFFIDGVATGAYPVARHRIRPGRYHLKISSDHDCAGMGVREIELHPGEHLELEASGTLRVSPAASPAAGNAVPACTSAFAKDRCLAAGGVWDVGLAGSGSCACPTRDGGKPCRISRECTTLCELSWELAVSLSGTRCGARGCTGPNAAKGLPDGRCAAHARTYGCRGWLDEEPGPDGPLRVTRYLCRD